MPDLIYLGSPYADASALVRESRFKYACRATAILFQQGLFVFSPIAHTHSVKIYGGLEECKWDYWQHYDRLMLSLSAKLVVLTIEGWRESVGLTAEIKEMGLLGKPVEYWNPFGG